MSIFIDKLERLSRGESQPIGFRRAGAASHGLKIQLVASLTQESVAQLTDYIAGADAGLVGISKTSSGAKSLQKMSQAVSGIPWGVWLKGNQYPEPKSIIQAGGDFVVFPASDTPLAAVQSDEAGRIIEVEASISEGLLRAVNELPVDAVLVTGLEGQGESLTWQHLLNLQRFADLLNKPLLVPVPAGVNAAELQALWESGVAGVVIEVTPGQGQDRFKELRQMIDGLSAPSRRRQGKTEPLLPRTRQEPGIAAAEEEDEE